MRMLSDSPAVVDASTVPLLVTPASASPAGGGSHASFDANMVVILAALLCVLICALGLKSLIRCALHGGRTLAAPPAAVVVVIAATPATGAGLEKRALRRIPVEVYESKAGVPDPECAICLGEFANGEKVRVLPRCHHGFHVPCIDMWLAEHSSRLICRNSLLERGAPARQMVDGEEAT